MRIQLNGKSIDISSGKSAYELAVDNGFIGTEEEWLESIKGPQGDQGPAGPDGKSAYQIAVDNGYTGTEQEWLDSLTMDGVSIKIVSYLPDTGEERILYFVPKVDGSNNDFYEEWMWINAKWEFIGTTKVDLSDYVTLTQFEAAISKAVTASVVTSLPETGVENILYFLQRTSPEANDYYEEWMWINSQWELIGSTKSASYVAGPGIAIEGDTISNTSRIVPLTSDEYNALSEEEKNREDVYYNVTDASNAFEGGSSNNSMEVYDDQERVIGTWFGKPLYRRCFNVTSPSSLSTNTSVLSLDDNIRCVNISGMLYATDGSIPPVNFAHSTAFVTCWQAYKGSPSIPGSNILMRVTVDVQKAVPVVLVLEYTKTTDNPTVSMLSAPESETILSSEVTLPNKLIIDGNEYDVKLPVTAVQASASASSANVIAFASASVSSFASNALNQNKS